MPISAIYITATILIIGAIPLPYGYYTLLRFVTTGVFVWAAFISYERKNHSLSWTFGFLALLFNPIVKIHLPKEIWIFLDIGSGLLLLLTKRHVQQEIKKTPY